jgi:hypothetical protein
MYNARRKGGNAGCQQDKSRCETKGKRLKSSPHGYMGHETGVYAEQEQFVANDVKPRVFVIDG